MLPERYLRKPSDWFTSHSEVTSAMFTIQCACAIQTSYETSCTSADSKIISEISDISRIKKLELLVFFMKTISLINNFFIFFGMIKSFWPRYLSEIQIGFIDIMTMCNSFWFLSSVVGRTETYLCLWVGLEKILQNLAFFLLHLCCSQDHEFHNLHFYYLYITSKELIFIGLAIFKELKMLNCL